MRIVRTSYRAAGPIGNMTITMFRIRGLRLRKKVLVMAASKKRA